MKTPNDLTFEQLAEIVGGIIDRLYCELDDDDLPVWNPEKEWDADVCPDIVAILENFDLIPDEPIPCPRHDKDE